MWWGLDFDMAYEVASQRAAFYYRLFVSSLRFAVFPLSLFAVLVPGI